MLSPFALAEDLRHMDAAESRPEHLPGRYGRVIADLQRLLRATETISVVAGGWAVWHHGYAGRVTEDVDIVVSHDAIKELERTAHLCGFNYLAPPPGQWPKLQHRDTGIDVDLLPQGGIPGTASRPAPVAINAPAAYGAVEASLGYISLTGLVELKLGAGRAKDTADLIEMIKLHPKRLAELRQHVAKVHPAYAIRFDELVQQAQEEQN